jgi:glycosyltransferase involved in cell wall biosynthesis
MQIILCNKYFFLNGGTERYFSHLIQQLTLMGHAPIPFSVKYANSWDSPYKKYFLDPPSAPYQAHLEDIRLTPTNWIRLLDRSIYSFEAKKVLSALLMDTGGADVAYILNIYNYMSPSIIHTFKKHRIPVILRVGDYNLLCANYLFLRNGKPCTLCIRGAYCFGFLYRCVKNSFAASAVRVFSMFVHRLLGLYHLVDAFVVPSEFMKTKLIKGGFPEERIHLLRSPVDQKIKVESRGKKEYILYFGRISYEKGLDSLIRAYQHLSPPVNLVIMGRNYDGEKERLQKLIQPGNEHRVQFLDFMAGTELSNWVSQALFTIVPSRCYDNAPYTIYESFLHETPVVAARIGGIPEQIQDGANGRLFDPDSEVDLKEALHWMLSDRKRLVSMGQAGRDFVIRNLSIEKHTEKLLALFEGFISR